MQEEKEPEKAKEKEGVDQSVDTNKKVEQVEEKKEVDAGIGGRPAKKG